MNARSTNGIRVALPSWRGGGAGAENNKTITKKHKQTITDKDNKINLEKNRKIAWGTNGTIAWGQSNEIAIEQISKSAIQQISKNTFSVIEHRRITLISINSIRTNLPIYSAESTGRVRTILPRTYDAKSTISETTNTFTSFFPDGLNGTLSFFQTAVVVSG